MNTLKKSLALGTILTGALLASGTASSAVLCSTLPTTDAWAAAGSCVDADGDTLLTFNAYGGNFPHTTGFITNQAIIPGVIDIYDVGFAWNPSGGFTNGYTGGGTILYTVTSLTGPRFAGASLDTTVQGSATVTKNLFDIGNPTAFLTLTSTNGAHDPLSGGVTLFGTRTTFQVLDTFLDATAFGVFLHADNSIVVAAAVPEPETYAMMLAGLGLMGFVARRKKQS